MRRIVLSICLCAIILTANAQQAGFGFVVGIPQTEFRKATKAEGYGINVTAMFPIGSEVINFGGNINYMVYGYNSQDKDLRADITVGNTVIDQIFIPLRVVNTSSIFGMHAMMRITAPTDGIRPYFEGLFGFRYLSTSTRIEVREDNFWTTNNDDDNVLVRKTNIGDFVMSYGGGGGLQIEIGDNAYLDLRAYYLLGGKAKFYDGSDTKRWDVTFTDTLDNYDPNNLDSNDFSFGGTPRESTTDMLMTQVGITFKF